MKKREDSDVLGRRLRILLPVAVLASAAVLGVAFAGAQQTVTKGPPPPTAAQVAALKTAALAFAKANGDPRPLRGELVGGTRSDAVGLLMNGAGVDTDPDVYAVQLEGDFIGNQFPQPEGAPPLKGRFLTIVYDATTGDLLDWGISNQRHDLAALGQSQTILP
jgi:hypothetical protein